MERIELSTVQSYDFLKNSDNDKLVHILNADGTEFQATLIPHSEGFLKFFEKNFKEFPNYSLLQHHSDYELFKEFKEMKARFKETSNRLL
jgi:hypothetical protein